MARSFLTAINLNKNELQNAAVQNLGTAPSAPVKGQLYYDSTGNVMYWWNGTTWVAAQGGASVSYGSVPAETTFGITKNDGVATTVARSDHTHGSPTHGAADHTTIPISTFAAAIANVNMGGFKVTNVGDPTAPTDAANKQYVDNSIAGLSWKDSVRVATIANVSLSGVLGAPDGVTLVTGDRILVKNQTTPSENGIYIYGSDTSLSRASDVNTAAEMLQATVYVEEGTTNADTAWTCTTNAPITLGTTALTFAQFAGGGAVTAGAGMTQAGNTLNVIAGDATLTVAADSIVRAPLTGDVTTAINAATITANAVTNAKLAQMPGYTLKGNGVSGALEPQDLTLTSLVASFGLVRKMNIFANAATSTVVTHNFGTQNVAVTVWHYSTAPYEEVDCDVEHTTSNTVTVRFAVAPAASEYLIVIMG